MCSARPAASSPPGCSARCVITAGAFAIAYVAGSRLPARLDGAAPRPLVTIALAWSSIVGLAITAFGTEAVVGSAGARRVDWFPIWLAALVAARGARMARARRSGARPPMPPPWPGSPRRADGRIGTAGVDRAAHGPGQLGSVGHRRLPQRRVRHPGGVVAARGLTPWRDLLTSTGSVRTASSRGSASTSSSTRSGECRSGSPRSSRRSSSRLTFVLIARLTDRNWVILGLVRGARHALRRGERRVVVAIDPEPRGVSGDAVRPRAGMPAPAVRVRCGRARRSRWVVLTTALFVQGVLFPEALLFLAVVGDRCDPLVHARVACRAPRPFAPLLWCTLTGVVLGAAFVAYLAIIGALGDFFGYFQTFAFGHALTGAVPARQRAADGTADAGRTPCRSSSRHSRSCTSRSDGEPRASTRPTGSRSSMAGWTVVYYPKFLARADLGHALQPNNVALALAAYVLHRLCDPAERLLLTQSWARTVARFTSTRLVTLPVAVVVLLALGLQPSIGLDDTAQRFHRTIPKPAELDASGYTTFDAFTPDATPAGRRRHDQRRRDRARRGRRPGRARLRLHELAAPLQLPHRSAPRVPVLRRRDGDPATRISRP